MPKQIELSLCQTSGRRLPFKENVNLYQTSSVIKKSGESHSTREISVILLMTPHIENSHLCPPNEVARGIFFSTGLGSRN